jgi:hypothetical protein
MGVESRGEGRSFGANLLFYTRVSTEKIFINMHKGFSAAARPSSPSSLLFIIKNTFLT